MPDTHFGAHSVRLSDFSYQKDCEIRSLLGSSTVFAIEVLTEIVDGSLKINLADLCDTFNCKESDLRPVLDVLAKAKLLKIEGSKLSIDKEVRKLFSFHLQKFEEDFVPGVGLIESQLMMLPVQILPTWYCVPKTAEDIFKTIREKYLSSIKAFETYQSEFILGDSLAKAVYDEVMLSSELKVPFKNLKEKFKVDDKALHEALLLLEYNFLCFLCYEQENECFEQYVVPYSELREFLLFKMTSVNELKKQKAPSKLASPIRWSLFDYSERDLREIEKDLKRFIDAGWIDFNEFINATIAHVGHSEAISLKYKNKKWVYERPNYSTKEIPIFHTILFGRLAELGVIEFAKEKDRFLFRIAPFGKAYLQR